ncbi:tetratricopeptide repeat protein [Asticcacaulis sp. YBE204]|uniref:tetratricopeptide repeat protein n=1 Tax=Asticcacaulis sp. YBE204 TaxID=1282363 RepID=UPI0003C3BC10|nr:tetratricopeptide repeat protein [Asticcacaulis sp. YBE204]ESQ79936.1 hypothetical protein AEYBE204_08800 [Asticcacaulis sp. YBE204]
MRKTIITAFAGGLCLWLMASQLAAQTMTPPPTNPRNSTYRSSDYRSGTSSLDRRTSDAKERRDAEKAAAALQADAALTKAIETKDYPYLLKRYDRDCTRAKADLARSKALPERATALNRTPQVARACHALAEMYHNGLGVPIDKARAAELYTDSMHLGITNSQDALIGLAADTPSRISVINGMANDPQLGFDNRCFATRKVAEMYAKGNGVEKDLSQTVKWHRLCYDSAGATIDTVLPGYVLNGALSLIDLYTRDDPKIRNLPEALAISERVNRSKGQTEPRYLAQAQYQAGRLLHSGGAGPKDTTRAIDLLEKAATAGQVDAMVFLADIYDRGEGVAADKAKASAWLDQAVQADSPAAHHLLGKRAYAGKDLPTAKARWLEAAKQGHAGAQYALGQYFLNDTAKTPNDQANAYVWLDVAARNGHPAAVTARDALKGQLPDNLLKAAESAETSLIAAYPKVIG